LYIKNKIENKLLTTTNRGYIKVGGIPLFIYILIFMVGGIVGAIIETILY